MAQNNKHLLSHSLCGSGIGEQLTWMLLAQGLSWVVSQDVSWGLGWGRNPLPNPPWAVGRKPQSSLCRPLHRAAEHHQDMDVAFPRARDERAEDEVTAPFVIWPQKWNPIKSAISYWPPRLPLEHVGGTTWGVSSRLCESLVAVFKYSYHLKCWASTYVEDRFAMGTF